MSKEKASSAETTEKPPVLASSSILAAESAGAAKGTIPVEISTRFLEHFSEQLYSSPQKAFEELISNGWDAGATCVDVRIPSDLSRPEATLSVLDNGASMDEHGLRELWHIAFSPKRDEPVQHGRRVVGKFGIGKLATYVLATKLTYICKSHDGIVRRVTMDYGQVDLQASADKLISQLSLELYELQPQEVEAAVQSIDDGAAILKELQARIACEQGSAEEAENDFGAISAETVPKSSDTWTLVILSGLKKTGRDIKTGILRKMLEAALPLSSEMTIRLNGERIRPAKLSAAVAKQWVIGPALKLTELSVDAGPSDEDDDQQSGSPAKKAAPDVIPVISGADPLPFIELPELGRITGKITLYQDKISGGKAEERGTSNGFFVNVLGRVVNQSDTSFGAENLSHTAWSRFRMTVRADGLNAFLNTNREQFREQRALQVFRAFLRKCFNIARSNYDSDSNAEMPHGGDVLVESLGVLSLAPLRSAVSEVLKTKAPIPGLFDDDGIADREKMRDNWRENTADNIRNAVETVRFEKISDDSFVKFRISDNSIIINKNHPFVAEHSRTKAEKELMRTVAMVNLLTDVFSLEAGILPADVQQVREYRDQLLRFRALQRRQSGTHIAKLLLSTSHRSGDSNEFEKVLADALRYLGLNVKEIGGSGEPEGIASAFGFWGSQQPSETGEEVPLYTFTYDAKSSKHNNAKTGNLSLDGINEHRIRYEADYALVVAPGFSEGSAAVRCEQLKITPMLAKDLGRLLEYTVECGAIPLDTLKQVFTLHDHTGVSEWTEKLGATLRRNRRFTIDVFLKALDALRGRVPDVLQPSLIAFTCRTQLGVSSVVDKDVIQLVRGLQILVPDLIGIDDRDRIVVNASAANVAAAVERQLENLHEKVAESDGQEDG